MEGRNAQLPRIDQAWNKRYTTGGRLSAGARVENGKDRLISPSGAQWLASRCHDCHPTPVIAPAGYREPGGNGENNGGFETGAWCCGQTGLGPLNLTVIGGPKNGVLPAIKRALRLRRGRFDGRWAPCRKTAWGHRERNSHRPARVVRLLAIRSLAREVCR